MSYTKGPWEIDYDNSDSGGGQWYIVGPAKVWFSYSDDGKEAKANARLISKAPDLLQELKVAYDMAEHYGENSRALRWHKLITEIEGDEQWI